MFALRLFSALVGLTAVFGMGTGVPPLQEPPRFCVFRFVKNVIVVHYRQLLYVSVVRSTY